MDIECIQLISILYDVSLCFGRGFLMALWQMLSIEKAFALRFRRRPLCRWHRRQNVLGGCFGCLPGYARKSPSTEGCRQQLGNEGYTYSLGLSMHRLACRCLCPNGLPVICSKRRRGEKRLELCRLSRYLVFLLKKIT